MMLALALSTPAVAGSADSSHRKLDLRHLSDSKRIELELKYVKETKYDPAIAACRVPNLTREQQDAMLCAKLGECTPDPSSTCEYRVQRWFAELRRQINQDPEQYFYNMRRLDCESR